MELNRQSEQQSFVDLNIPLELDKDVLREIGRIDPVTDTKAPATVNQRVWDRLDITERVALVAQLKEAEESRRVAKQIRAQHRGPDALAA